MAEQIKRRRRDPIDLVPIGFMAVAIVATVPGSHHESIFLVIVRHLSLALAYGVMLWRDGHKTELERLIFYKATTIAFCTSLAMVLGYSLLRDLGVVSDVSLELIAQVTVMIWILATVWVRSRAT